MAYLYLIRHPLTRPDPEAPASAWHLTNEGHAQVRALTADSLWRAVTVIYTSREVKTTVVGEAIRAAHGIPHHPIAELGEARRDAWLGADQFQAAQRDFFAHPDRPAAPDWETAQAAQGRFVAALDALLNRHPPGEALAVVSHATVLTLYVAHLRGEPPSYDTWQQLGFMDVMAVDRATRQPDTPFLAPPYPGLPRGEPQP
ncbi:MAG: histidine phosphatase family protein [Chloroflexi bacterium]|nr:histidine phosphatase family protein [Chloroflexota bacterium]